ncbi:MAG: SPFH domain-containing protein, partial [Ilumatobacteraceae bacterium]
MSGSLIGILIGIAVIVLLVLLSLRTVQQGNVAVTTIFGKYHRTLRPGLNFVVPIFEQVYRRISVQNRAVELQFQAISQDQANIYFTAMMVYSAIN